ncbi:hypothetical protein AB0C96_13875 [Streptomyces sp. NPDC048506]|uniref:hypothetical protein n=1 Tax=Streptomyces sp. NPDC048506 TaxID=3155028 RepID=UPI003430C034
MASARSTNGRVRDRGSAVPFRVLWLTVVLISVLVAHGARAESAEGPLLGAVPAAVASAVADPDTAAAADSGTAAAADPGVRRAPDAGIPAEHADHPGHPGHSGEHSHELCVSGHPQQGAAVPPPCARPLTGSSWRTPTQGRHAPPMPAAAALPPPVGGPGSVVQQV